MVLEAFQLKLLRSSWPPAYHLTACILPPETLSSLPKVIAPHIVSKGSLEPSPGACLDIPRHPASRYGIQESNRHAILSGITKPHGCMPDRASVSLYHCIFLKSGIWRVTSMQKYMWLQAVRSFLLSPRVRLPATKPSPTSAAWGLYKPGGSDDLRETASASVCYPEIFLFRCHGLKD